MSASLMCLFGPSKTWTDSCGANFPISFTHCVIMDLGTTMRVFFLGFPSMVAINWIVLPIPGSSASIQLLQPDVWFSIVKRYETASFWYGAKRLPLRRFLARLYCSSIVMVLV